MEPISRNLLIIFSPEHPFLVKEQGIIPIGCLD